MISSRALARETPISETTALRVCRLRRVLEDDSKIPSQLHILRSTNCHPSFPCQRGQACLLSVTQQPIPQPRLQAVQ